MLGRATERSTNSHSRALLLATPFNSKILQIRYNGWQKLFKAVRENDMPLAIKLLSCLEPTEMLWGFPGPDMIAQIRKFLEQNVCLWIAPTVIKYYSFSVSLLAPKA